MTVDFDFSELTYTSLEQRRKQQVIVVDRPECVASFSVRGGQLLSYTPRGHHPLFWNNTHIDYDTEKELRQGIPICWPWFGALDRNPEEVQAQFAGQYDAENPAPFHGLVRGLDWDLLNIQDGPDTTELLFSISIPAPKLRLLARYSVGVDLNCELTSKNLTDSEVHISYALHSYFAISDIQQAYISGLDGIPYLDVVKRWEKHLQNGDLAIQQEVDRAFYNTPSIIRLKDQGWHRLIAIESETSQSAVVWNPWQEKSRNISQYSADSYRQTLCVETARILTDHVVIPAHDSQTLQVSFTSQNT